MSQGETTVKQGGGYSPVTIIIIMAVIAGAVWFMSGGSGGPNDSPKTDNDTSQTLSGNEMLSRNTAAGFVLGDLTNMFYDCIGANACTFDSSTDTQVDSSTTDASVNTATTTEVSGERNTLTMSNGETACENPDAPGQYSPGFCNQQ